MDLPDYQLPNFQKEHAIILVAVLGVVLSFYFKVPGFLYSGEEIALDVAEQNGFMSEFREQGGVEEVSTTQLPSSTVEELKESGDLPGSTSNNVYIVDYVKNQEMGVSAYVDVSKREVVDTKYNYRIN